MHRFSARNDTEVDEESATTEDTEKLVAGEYTKEIHLYGEVEIDCQ